MSAKPSAQPGRRTPLSLSGAVTKSQPNKGSNNIANGGASNANGQSSNNNKQDIKSQQQKNDQQVLSSLETKDNSNRKQQTQAEKKSQQIENKKSNEKNQNGMSSNKQQDTSGVKQQQQNKEKLEQTNGNEVNKIIEEEKKEKTEKSEKTPKDTSKSKVDKKEEQNIPENKKVEKKIKEAKKEASTKSDAISEPQQSIKSADKKSEDEEKVKNVDNNLEEKVENLDKDNVKQVTSANTGISKSKSKANSGSTPVNKTPTKFVEKTPQKSTPTKIVNTTPVTKREVTTTIDDIEMEPLAVESSPVKQPQPEKAANIRIVPSATSTPGKLPKRGSVVPKYEVQQQAMQPELSPERPRMFSQISGRKSIRPISDYTPSKFQSNLQFRESYRRINTELDVTNTSMNVTVGSEVPSNFSYSFFGYGRKRERTPPQHSQSAIGDLHTDIELSPPKKARLDIHGLFSVVSSPLTLLRNRFSKTSLQSSTPVKVQQNLKEAEDEIEVQNVSGVSVHEEIATSDKEPVEINNTIDDNDATMGEEARETKLTNTDAVLPSPLELNADGKEFKEVLNDKVCGMDQSFEHSDIKIVETPLQAAVGDPMAKNKRCVVM